MTQITHMTGHWVFLENRFGGWSIQSGDEIIIAQRSDWNHRAQESLANGRLFFASRELLAACKAQHNAIDILLAMLIERDHSFSPSKSSVWPLLVQGSAAIAKAEAP